MEIDQANVRILHLGSIFKNLNERLQIISSLLLRYIKASNKLVKPK